MKIRQTKRIDDNGNEIFLSYDDYGNLNSEVWEEDGIYSAKIHTPDGVKKIYLTEEDGKRMIEIARESYNEEQRESRRHMSLDAMDPEDRFFADDFDPVNKLGEEYRKKLLKEAVKLLPSGQKEILIKVFFMNMKQSEIAKEKGVSPAAVSKQLSNALENIRKYIEKEETGQE